MSHLINMAGQRIGRLTVIKQVPSASTNARWLCKCDCGNEITVLGTTLRRGESQSCGCYRADYWRKQQTKHGLCHTSVAHTWYGMRQRCNNKRHHAYKNYGGRGISVCPQWEKSFEAFYEYVSALPHYGEEGRTLDRINNDGNYEPGNVRWATKKEQSMNRRKPWKRKFGIRVHEV